MQGSTWEGLKSLNAILHLCWGLNDWKVMRRSKLLALSAGQGGPAAGAGGGSGRPAQSRVRQGPGRGFSHSKVGCSMSATLMYSSVRCL